MVYVCEDGVGDGGGVHEIVPVASTEYAAPAKRPRYSVLDNAKLRGLGLDVMKDWRDGLARFVRLKYGQG